MTLQAPASTPGEVPVGDLVGKLTGRMVGPQPIANGLALLHMGRCGHVEVVQQRHQVDWRNTLSGCAWGAAAERVDGGVDALQNRLLDIVAPTVPHTSPWKPLVVFAATLRHARTWRRPADVLDL